MPCNNFKLCKLILSVGTIYTFLKCIIPICLITNKWLYYIGINVL